MGGMAADQLVRAVAERARRGKALGAVIVSLQQTACDGDAALRIFAPLDRVAVLLKEELKLEITEPSFPYAPVILPQYRLRTDVFSVPYDVNGRLHGAGEARNMFDLSPGAELTVAAGPDAGQVAISDGRNEEGHYALRVGSGSYRKTVLLGAWWVEAAVVGSVPSMPVVSIQP